MKVKALFLFTIFMLNTVVGFSCALHMKTSEHKHNHLQKINHEMQESCCKTLVKDLVAESKIVPEKGKLLTQLPMILLERYSFSAPTLAPGLAVNCTKYADHRYRPPNYNIRIAIQSFQI